MAPARDDNASSERSALIAVTGRPNVGKSTLINCIVGSDVVIVSPVAQTTRRVVRAAANLDGGQLVFVDLPGSQQPIDRMTARMQAAVEHTLHEVDMLLWVVAVGDSIGPGERHLLKLVREAGCPSLIAVNKTDAGKPDQVIATIGGIADLVDDSDYRELVPVSALTGDGVDTLVSLLLEHAPEAPPIFPDDMVTDQRDDERIADIIREASLAHLRDELPHATLVDIDEIDRTTNPTTINVTIWVERESQVGIVVGAGGDRIRDIGTISRPRIEKVLGEQVFLDIRVKSRGRWRDDESALDKAGL